MDTSYHEGFPRRLENLENENGHGKVMEHNKLATGNLSVPPPPELYQICMFFGHH